MDMRVTPFVVTSDAIANAQHQYAQLAITQQQASSGNRILQPSDDPFGTIQVLSAQAQSQQITTDLGNVSDATSKLNTSISALNQVAGVLSQASNIALQGSSTSTSPVDNQALAQQVDALLTQLKGLANTQLGGQYLFGGTASTQPPFTTTTQGGVQQIVYQGSQQRASEPIGSGQSVTTFYTGQEIFQSQERQTTQITGTTGATPGSGTDNATAAGTLLVQHTSTSYAGTSGVQPGSSSAGGDTILGPAGANTLTIVDTSGTGASGTVSLNNGPAVAFTSSDANLQVQDGNGQVVYLNTTAISPGFNGSIKITSTGALSTDGGKSTVPIDFSSNQVVTNSLTGATTNINSSSIHQTGTDSISYPGTSDAFQALQALSDSLNNTSGLSPSQQAAQVSSSITELNRIRENVLNIVGQQGASVQNLQSYQSSIQNVQLQTKQLESNVGGADLSQVLINLQAQQNALQLTLASSARLLSLSLLSFLH